MEITFVMMPMPSSEILWLLFSHMWIKGLPNYRMLAYSSV